jgi:hypothetical protein
MKRVLLLLTATLLMGVPSPAGAAPAASAPAAKAPATRPAPLPTPAEIRAAFDRGDYEQTLKHLTRVLALSGKAAAPYGDRYELILLKAETHLRLKQFASAGEAFGAAAKLTKDEVQAATARATAKVILQTKGPRVVRRHPPKGAPPESADLLDPARRKDVLRIFRDDLRAEAEPKVKAAQRATTIPPITEALDLIYLKLDFELATDDGTYEQDLAKRVKLADQARGLMAEEIARLEAQVQEIWDSASTPVSERMSEPEVLYGVSAMATYRGLSNTDRADLKAAIATCNRIAGTVNGLARATGGSPADAKLVRDAREVGRIAKNVLTQSYRERRL